MVGTRYFTLELDTTPPTVEIVAPPYTVPGIYTEIWVMSDEVLDLYQDIYIIDSKGKRFNLTFAHHGDHLYGLYDFWNCSLGIAKVYARVRDEVYNLSNIAIHTINIQSEISIKRLIGRFIKDEITTIINLEGRTRLEIPSDDLILRGSLTISYDEYAGLIGKLTYKGEETQINLTGKTYLRHSQDPHIKGKYKQ